MNTNAMTGGQDPGYVMGRTSGEYERLRRQSELLDSITVTVLDQVGLGFGMQCLDVGCGPGEVMRLMAERVGPTGRVVGIDLDGKLGSEALSVLTIKAIGSARLSRELWRVSKVAHAMLVNASR